MGDQRQSNASDLAPWLACLAHAVPLAMVLIWLVSELAMPVSAIAGFGLYLVAFVALLPLAKPWSHRPTSPFPTEVAD